MYKGLEYQFCSSWIGWDEIDVFALQFNNVTLLPEVAKVVGRSFVDCMTIWGSECQITFWCDDGFEVTLSFKAKLALDSQ